MTSVTPPEDPPADLRRAQAGLRAVLQGKALALAGESDCAREAFRDALERFRIAAREGNPVRSRLRERALRFDRSLSPRDRGRRAGARSRTAARRGPARQPRRHGAAPLSGRGREGQEGGGVGAFGNRLRHPDRRERRRAQGRRLLPVPDAHGLRRGPEAQGTLPRPDARHPQGGGRSAGSRLRRDGRVRVQVPGTLPRRRARLLAVHRGHRQALRAQAERARSTSGAIPSSPRAPPRPISATCTRCSATGISRWPRTTRARVAS